MAMAIIFWEGVAPPYATPLDMPLCGTKSTIYYITIAMAQVNNHSATLHLNQKKQTYMQHCACIALVVKTLSYPEQQRDPGDVFRKHPKTRGPFGAKFVLLFTLLYDAQTLSQPKQQGMPGETFISSCLF